MYFISYCQRCWKWFSLAWRCAGMGCALPNVAASMAGGIAAVC